MSWAYSPSYGKPLSVPQGIIALFTRFGMNVELAHPEGYELLPGILEIAQENAGESGGSFTVNGSMEEWVERLAQTAFDAGIRGLVASAKELPMLRSKMNPELQLVIPGIRPAMLMDRFEGGRAMAKAVVMAEAAGGSPFRRLRSGSSRQGFSSPTAREATAFPPPWSAPRAAPSPLRCTTAAPQT